MDFIMKQMKTIKNTIEKYIDRNPDYMKIFEQKMKISQRKH